MVVLAMEDKSKQSYSWSLLIYKEGDIYERFKESVKNPCFILN